MSSKFGSYSPDPDLIYTGSSISPQNIGGLGPYSPQIGGVFPNPSKKNDLIKEMRAIAPCRRFQVTERDKVQFNIAAYMYYKGSRLTRIVDEHKKDLHPKLTQELHALNLGLDGTDHYVYVSICSAKRNS